MDMGQNPSIYIFYLHTLPCLKVNHYRNSTESVYHTPGPRALPLCPLLLKLSLQTAKSIIQCLYTSLNSLVGTATWSYHSPVFKFFSFTSCNMVNSAFLWNNGLTTISAAKQCKALAVRFALSSTFSSIVKSPCLVKKTIHLK